MKIPAWTFLVLPLAAFGIGFVCNAAAMYFNGGTMPVYLDSCTQAMLQESTPYIHSCMSAQTHLKLLCDIFLLRSEHEWASIGDFFEMFGNYTLITGATIWAATVLYKAGIIGD